MIGQDYYIQTASRKFIHTKFFFLINVINVRNARILIGKGFGLQLKWLWV